MERNWWERLLEWKNGAPDWSKKAIASFSSIQNPSSRTLSFQQSKNPHQPPPPSPPQLYLPHGKDWYTAEQKYYQNTSVPSLIREFNEQCWQQLTLLCGAIMCVLLVLLCVCYWCNMFTWCHLCSIVCNCSLYAGKMLTPNSYKGNKWILFLSCLILSYLILIGTI